MLFISLIFCLHCAILGNDRKPCSSFHYSFCHVSNIVFTILLNMKIYHFFFAIAKVPNILIPLEMQTQHKGSFASSYVGCKFSEYLVSTISRQVLDHILRGYVFEHKGHFILEQAYQGDVGGPSKSGITRKILRSQTSLVIDLICKGDITRKVLRSQTSLVIDFICKGDITRKVLQCQTSFVIDFL